MSDKMNFFGKIMTLHILSCSTNAFLHCTTAGIPLKPAYSRKTSCKQLALTESTFWCFASGYDDIRTAGLSTHGDKVTVERTATQETGTRK